MTATDAEERVVLVDEQDRETGRAEKLAAHREGLLHRAISVIVHDGAGRHLLQKRQAGKYHSQGQWSNACCSHPRPGETPLAAAHRRLREEMGIECTLLPLFETVYRHDVGNGLVEHEYVHVFEGKYDGPVRPDPAEADGYQWLKHARLVAGAAGTPAEFTPWLKIYLAAHGAAIAAAVGA